MLTLFLLLYVYGGDDYLVNLKVVSILQNGVIFPVFFFKKCTAILLIFYSDFLTALLMMPIENVCFLTSLYKPFPNARTRLLN